MKIQIVSDIHLEFHDEKKLYSFIKPSALILCILGDLCCCENSELKKLQNFFSEVSSMFKLIIWIPGNHEYYQEKRARINKNNTMPAIDRRCKIICSKYKNVKFLKNQTLDYEYRNNLYRFICSTLWSHIPNNLGNDVQNYMSDYSSIYVWSNKNKNPRNITYKDVNAWHKKCVKFINTEIEKTKEIKKNNGKKSSKYKSVKTIVLTHHKPFSTTSDYGSDKERVAYESDQSHILGCGHVNLWCYGHTHRSFNGRAHKCRIISNPKGYPSQRTNYIRNHSINI